MLIDPDTTSMQPHSQNVPPAVSLASGGHHTLASQDAMHRAGGTATALGPLLSGTSGALQEASPQNGPAHQQQHAVHTDLQSSSIVLSSKSDHHMPFSNSAADSKTLGDGERQSMGGDCHVDVQPTGVLMHMITVHHGSVM